MSIRPQHTVTSPDHPVPSHSASRNPRATRPLRARDPDVALAGCGRAIPDWSGGTRPGETIKVFLDRWRQRGVAWQAVVVLARGGRERGDPGLLAEQVRRLFP
jgi:uncharacterized protein